MSLETYTYSKNTLLVKDLYIDQDYVIASGQGNLTAGTILGKITASGKYGVYDNTHTDGTETAVCILAEDIDATDTDVTAKCYVLGLFRRDKMTGLDAEGKTDLNARGIYFK